MSEIQKDEKFIQILSIMLFIIACCYLSFVFTKYHSMSDRGLFGDTFSGLNVIFSAFSLIIIIYTVILQIKELKLQRQELELTREELRKSAEAQVKSEKALQQQISSMEKTAKLNGLSSKLNYCGSVLVSATTGTHTECHVRDNAKEEAEKIKQEIDTLLK